MNRTANAGYEVSDASVPKVIAGAVAILLGIVASLGAAFGLMRPIDHRENPVREFAHGLSEQRPLQSDWLAVQAEASVHLDGYGWVDRSAGLARIPIGRAMAIMAAKDGSARGKRP